MSSEVSLFGSFSVAIGGRVLGALEFGGRKPKQLLEILALRAGRHVAKENLALLLWGDKLPANPSGSLEHYVSLLRRRLDPNSSPQQSLIVTEHGGYRFDTEKAWVDVHAFDGVAELAAAGNATRMQLEQALSWVRGDLLEDEPYAEWVIDGRANYQQRHVQMLVTAAELALADRDIVRARDLAQMAVAQNSLVESGYRVLMLAAYAQGEQGEALRTFQQVRRVLAAELGIDPMPATAELHQSMLLQAEAEDLLPVRPVRPMVAIPTARDASRTQVPATAHPLAGGTDAVPHARRSGDAGRVGQGPGTDSSAQLVERLRGLDPDLLSVAAVSAFVPQPCVPEEVARLTGLSPLYAAELQERLCHLGVLLIDGDGFSFVRDDQRATLIEILSPARRRLLESGLLRPGSWADRWHRDAEAAAAGEWRSWGSDGRVTTADRPEPDAWQAGWSARVSERVG
jgi:DNA-binding SARP family transcriptional activator